MDVHDHRPWPREPRGRLGLATPDPQLLGRDFLVREHLRQHRLIGGLRFLAVDREPAGIQEHFAFGLERLADDTRDARGQEILRWRVEDRQEALDDEVVELRFGLGQALGLLQRRNDREVVRNLGVVENAFVGLDPFLLQDLPREGAIRIRRAERFERRPDRRKIILGEGTRVGPRIGEHLVPFVERLRQRQRSARRETKATVGLTLQTRQVVEQRRALRRGLGFLADGAGLALALGRDRACGGFLPQAFRAGVGVVVRLAEFLVEPTTLVGAAGGAKRRENLPEIARLEVANPLLTLDQDRQRRGLHSSDRRELEAARLRVERGHRARAIDADEPIGLRAAHCGVGERPHRLVTAQCCEAFADRAGRHRLQPQTLDRLGRLRVLNDVAEDELALAAGIAGVDELDDVLALDQLEQES